VKFLKKVASHPFLKGFLSWENWPYWLAALAVIGLAFLLWLSIKRRRAKRAEPVIQEPKEGPLPKAVLANIWKEFLRGIPRVFRRSIMLYQHYVVMGESGVGKSQLIDTYTDWQGQASQFYPSYTVDPLLQIYLGSKVIVQEIPAPLLDDTSKPVHDALVKLWKSLFRKNAPTVVVVLNGATLESDSVEFLKKQAQVMRGKINIISRLCKEPVKVCIALTHMDHREGFLEFSDFLRQNNIPLTLEFDSKADLQDIGTCLEPYEAYLSRALTTLPAEDYLRIMSFLRHSTQLFSALSVFTKILQSPDPLSSEPEILRLSLTSHEVRDSIISNPFVPASATEDVRTFHPLRKHRLVAAALGVLGLTYLVGAYLYEYRLLSETDRAMDKIEAAPPPQYDENMHRVFLDVTYSLKKDPLLAFLPNFFPDANQAIKQRAISNIQRLYLFPRLKLLVGEEGVKEKTLYLLALIYASKENDLGKLVLQHITEWTRLFDLSAVAAEGIEYYVNHNDEFAQIVLPVDSLGLGKLKGITPDQDVQPWLVYFSEIRKAYDKPVLTKRYMQRLQTQADPLLNVIHAMDRYDLSAEICGLLNRDTPCVIKTDWLQRRESELRQQSVRGLLRFLKEKDISHPSAENLSLDELMENIKAMMVLTAREEKRFQFRIAGNEYVFITKKWNELVDSSRITWFLQDFVTQNKWHDGLLFFQTENEFPDLAMNPSNDGHFFFTGRGKVDGRFTRHAFEQRVKPALLELPEFLQSLPIPPEEKTRFSNFVFDEVLAYADVYVSEFLHYYREFGVQAENFGGFRYVLTQMQLPSSQFQNFLLTMKENTALDVGDNPYLQPFAIALQEFGFIQRLMQEGKGVYPELDKYKTILAQMQRDLESDEAFVGENETDEANELKWQLSPLGRISIAIFRNEEDSYLNLAKKWLKSVGGDTKGWQDPFLAPFYQAYEMGLTETEATLSRVWEDLRHSDVQPVLASFPFDARAETVVSPEMLEAVFRPQRGSFWQTFDPYLGPLFVEKGGIWRERRFPGGSLQLPEDILDTVNGIARLTRTLWDEEGIPQPLSFSIKPMPLPSRYEHEPPVVLTYLKCGEGSVFGFNQQPSWETFQIEWWKESTATVGVVFAPKRKSGKESQIIGVPQSTWSFYRLLQKSELAESAVRTWRIENPQIENKFLDVKFSIRGDPWDLFQIKGPA